MKKVIVLVLALLLAPTSTARASTTPAIPAIPAAAAKPQVILEMVAKSQQAQLNLVIPKNTKPGYHIITVQILDSHGVLSSRDVAFCKKTTGTIEWNNKCPGLKSVASNQKAAHALTTKSAGTQHNKSSSSGFNLWLVGVGLLLILASWWLLIGRRRRRDQEDKELIA